MTSQSRIIYKCKDELIVKYLHTQVSEYLSYDSMITIKDNGKNPVSIKLKFNDILPEWAEMPPEKHEISAPTILQLYEKLSRWFRKCGYTIYVR